MSPIDFVSLYETVESLTTDQKKTWDRLFMLSDRREQYIHPLIYLHPVTKREVQYILAVKFTVENFTFNSNEFFVL